MIKKLFKVICLVVLGTNLCMAQSIDQPNATNWGKSVQGVQLSITMTMTNSSAIEAGASFTLMAVIKNSSTNAVRVEYTALPSDYDILLISGAGKTYHLIIPPLQLRLNTSLAINPGEQDVRIIPVTIRKNTEPGDYTLQAVRDFYIGETTLRLESNSLKVQIR